MRFLPFICALTLVVALVPGGGLAQPSRWDQIVHERQAMGLSKGLSEEFMARLLSAIHEESIAHQNRVMNQPPQS